MKLKNILLTVLALGLTVSVSEAATTTLRNKPAGLTREQAVYLALKDTMNTNGTLREQSVTPNSGSETASVILPGSRNVSVGTVTNGVTDFIVLPAIASVPAGHEIHVCSNAGGAYEIRTVASSGTEINGVDCDGTQEYLAVDTEVHVFVKVSDTDGWVAYDIPAAGGVGAATVPD